MTVTRSPASGADVLHARLAEVRRKRDRATALRAALVAVAAGLGLAFLAIVAEELFYFSPTVRAIILWGVLALSVATFAVLGGTALLRLLKVLPPEDDEKTARFVGDGIPELGDRLVNGLQLVKAYRSGAFQEMYSSDLMRAAIADLSRTVEPIDFTRVVSLAGSRKAARVAGISFAVLFLLFVLSPSSFLGSAYRLWHTGEVFAAPAPFRLLVEPGDREIVKGESVRIITRAEGAVPETVELSLLPEGQNTEETHIVPADNNGEYRYDIGSLKASTSYSVRSGSVQTQEYHLRVVDRPLIRLLRVTTRPPSYTGLPARTLDDNVGDISALKGTRIEVALESNKDLVSANLQFSKGPGVGVQVDGMKGKASFVLREEGTYHAVLKDKEGQTNIDPIEYTLKIMPDEYPSVSIVTPGTSLDVTDNTSLPMVFRISDDFGFTKLRIAYKLVRSRYEQPWAEYKYQSVPIPKGIGNDGFVQYTWSLSSLGLVPEDAVSYHAEVFDNDAVSGPKSAVSEEYTLRLPSINEVFADADKSHESSMENLQESLTEAQQARKDLEQLIQDSKKQQQKLDWQDQKKAEQLSQKYQDIQKKLEDVKKTIDQMTSEMQKNQVLSKETLQKYMELQQLMEQMNSPEFAEAMKQLQQAMEKMSPDAMRKALENFSFSEENFRKSIERTMNLLKRLQVEQKLDQTMKRLAEMEKKQEELKEKTSDLKKGEDAKAADLAKQQEGLKQEAAQLKEEMESLQKKMEEFPSEMPLNEMQQANSEMAESQLDQQMGQISDQIQNQQTMQASAGQNQALQKMQRLSQKMQAVKEGMMQRQQQQVLNEMRRDVKDLLELSKRQEELKNQSQQTQQNSPSFRQNAGEQMDIMQDLSTLSDRMSSLAQKTFAVSPEMGKAIGDAMRAMSESMKALEQRNGAGATGSQAEAMASLNQGAQLMQGAMEAMQQGGEGGMGMMGFMQRLKQLSGMQQGINQGTEQAQGMTQEQAASLARLAGEQGMVRKSLEQLQREAASAGELHKMLGDLTGIANEMREVQTNLAQGNVNPETVRRQQRILSRLLDAQRSTQERDYEKTRRAETGKDISKPSPGPLDLSSQEAKDKLRRDLLRALEQGYTRDYEEMIRKYFEALESQPQ